MRGLLATFGLLLTVSQSGCLTAPCAPTAPLACEGGCDSACATNGCGACQPPRCGGYYHYKAFCDDQITRHTARHCAGQALKQFDGPYAKCSHFRDGFSQAFEDLATGSRPIVPAVPPRRYWHAYYRSSEGRPAVDEWFAGYQAGIEAAPQSGVTDFNRIVLSPMASQGTVGLYDQSGAENPFAGGNGLR